LQSVAADLGGDRQAGGPFPYRVEQSAIGEDGRVNAAYQFLQAFQGTPPVGLDFAQRAFGQVLVPAQLIAGQAQPREYRDEFLLHSIVDVTLQPAAAGFFGVHEAGP
jgi:hypothetical protein